MLAELNLITNSNLNSIAQPKRNSYVEISPTLIYLFVGTGHTSRFSSILTFSIGEDKTPEAPYRNKNAVPKQENKKRRRSNSNVEQTFYPNIKDEKWSHSADDYFVNRSYKLSDKEKRGTKLPESCTTPEDIFRFYFDNVVLNHILDCTNSRESTHSYPNPVKFENVKQVETFFIVWGICGLLCYPTEKSVWTGMGNLFPSKKFIAQMLPYEKFIGLKKSIRYDVDWIENYLNYKFRIAWNLGSIVTIDETLFPFKGNFPALQYIKGKPDSTGLKVYMMCDECPYCYSFWVYKGKERTKRDNTVLGVVSEFLVDAVSTPIQPQPSNTATYEEEQYLVEVATSFGVEDSPPRKKQCTSVDYNDDSDEDPDFALDKRELMKELQQDRYDDIEYVDLHDDETQKELPKDSTVSGVETLKKMKKEKSYNPFQTLVIADCYYGKYDVASICQEMGFYCIFCCSANKDKELKDDISKGLQKGLIRNIWNESEHLNYCIWHDSRIISLISNYSSGYFCQKKNKKKKKGKQKIHYYPESAIVYNKYMNLVDQFDSYLKAYWNTHRKQKWTQALLYGIVKLVTVNCFVQYASISKSSMTYVTFLIMLFSRLAGLADNMTDRDGNEDFDTHFALTPVANKDRKPFCQVCTNSSRCAFTCGQCSTPVHVKCAATHYRERHHAKVPQIIIKDKE